MSLHTAALYQNQITGNRIHSNGGFGIDLGNNGSTANDPGDTDTGPNHLQNYPVLTSVTVDGILTSFEGTLESTPNTLFNVEYYLNATCDGSGYGEGAIYLDSNIGTSDSNGTLVLDNFGLQYQFPPTPATPFVTAIATADYAAEPGDTSEFSQCCRDHLHRRRDLRGRLRERDDRRVVGYIPMTIRRTAIRRTNCGGASDAPSRTRGPESSKRRTTSRSRGPGAWHRRESSSDEEGRAPLPSAPGTSFDRLDPLPSR